MKKLSNLLSGPILCSALIAISIIFIWSCQTKMKYRFADYVDPFIGTDAHGHTYPGASVPFGMVQLSPDTRLHGWDGTSGYHYSDSIIYGFTHTALSGTGVGDYGDILIMPSVGTPTIFNNEYLSPFKKSNEIAKAGYYSVFLDKPNVLAEMTTTTRVGYHRYTFPESTESNLIIDLFHRDKVLDSKIEFISNTEISGYRRSSNWADDMIWYFNIKFSKPFKSKGIAINDSLYNDINYAVGQNIKAYVCFDTYKNEQIEVKVSLSPVDNQGALNNRLTEIPEWNFDDIKEIAFNTWNKELSKIEVKGGSNEQKRIFYTALYHAFLQPNTYIDVDNRYRAIDKKIYTTSDYTNYTVFSLWDTYRTWHPLMTIIDQKRTIDFIKVMLDIYSKGGLLPIWELAANETYCMIGNHAISVIADAYIKGIDSFDTQKALEAMINSTSKDHFGLKAYRENGYIPGDLEHESISKTLEYAYNDWCIAQVAKKMKREDIYKEYITRAQYYKNIFDPNTRFMRPKLNGGWLEPFDPTTVDWHYTEANSWQYSFYVPHDISGLINLHGGKTQLSELIDELFKTDQKITGRDMKDITGLIGQYAHGNEPSHHMAYLYSFLNQPWKTQAMVRQIMDNLYSDKPDGLSGNEDCGQMSAWLIMSAMGFYPVTPGSPVYTIGTPWFPEIKINLENNKVFKITADNLSNKKYYIQSATLNNKKYSKSYITHSDIMNGGELHFNMGKKPNKLWGSGDDDIPKTEINEHLIVTVPVIETQDNRIRESIYVKINNYGSKNKIFYTLDTSKPNQHSFEYNNPIKIDKTTTITAISYLNDTMYSFPVKANFYKIDIDRKINILSKWNKNYHAGGEEGLIDGIRGATNWRLGGWQGYQGTDFIAIVDLGKIKDISYIGAGFIQDIRSWIWMPKDVTFYSSNDGINFNIISKKVNNIADDKFDVIQKDFFITPNIKSRYIKVIATNYGIIPQWHLGAGGNAFIFIDEIIID